MPSWASIQTTLNYWLSYSIFSSFSWHSTESCSDVYSHYFMPRIDGLVGYWTATIVPSKNWAHQLSCFLNFDCELSIDVVTILLAPIEHFELPIIASLVTNSGNYWTDFRCNLYLWRKATSFVWRQVLEDLCFGLNRSWSVLVEADQALLIILVVGYILDLISC